MTNVPNKIRLHVYITSQVLDIGEITSIMGVEPCARYPAGVHPVPSVARKRVTTWRWQGEWVDELFEYQESASDVTVNTLILYGVGMFGKCIDNIHARQPCDVAFGIDVEGDVTRANLDISVDAIRALALHSIRLAIHV
jgi:hypothetical protein